MTCEYDAALGALGDAICCGDVSYVLTVEPEGEDLWTLTLCSQAAEDVEQMLKRDRGGVQKTLRRIEAARDG